MHFSDTGLLSYLLDIETPEEYQQNEYKGQIFENYVISEVHKHYNNANQNGRLSYYRDDNKIEVDLINQTKGCQYNLCEIKDTTLYKHKFKKNLKKVASYLDYSNKCSCVVYNGKISFTDNDINIINISDYLNTL